MANRTVKDAHSIHGTNPQYLVEKIIRTRIYESKYWKEECFGLTEFELMHVDEFIDELLHSERVCDIILPRLQVRDKGHTY
uniref:Pre-mRNA processing factor 38A n=1 Tax=Ovis aries TaxID=9940 RepID=A0AC11DQR2_SHEEP